MLKEIQWAHFGCRSKGEWEDMALISMQGEVLEMEYTYGVYL